MSDLSLSLSQLWAGAEQSKALGSWLRELYLPEFCGPEYDIRNLQSPEKPVIQLRSTNFLRTHLTGDLRTYLFEFLGFSGPKLLTTNLWLCHRHVCCVQHGLCWRGFLAAQRQRLQFQSAVEMKLMRICTTMMTIAPGEDRENASLFLQYKTLPKFGSRHLLQVSSLSLWLSPFQEAWIWILQTEETVVHCLEACAWISGIWWQKMAFSLQSQWHLHPLHKLLFGSTQFLNFSAVCFGFFVTETHKVLPVIRKCKMQWHKHWRSHWTSLAFFSQWINQGFHGSQ
jgi:hypothetical protein